MKCALLIFWEIHIIKYIALPVNIRFGFGASLVAQMVKHLSTMQETWVRALGWEDPLEKEMAVHSSTIAWKILWTEEPGGYSPWGRKESDMTE